MRDWTRLDVLQRALIEKAGNDNGFEHVLTSTPAVVELGSARHKARVAIAPAAEGFTLTLLGGNPLLAQELARQVPALTAHPPAFPAASPGALARVLRRAAALAQSLPSQAANDFESTLQHELATLPPDLIKHTEYLAEVRQRVGQQSFRKAMLDYWGGACAVTGIEVAEVLRASHAKPWAECQSDAERLDVFNGFLLCANLDALFDRFLISFDDEGQLLVSSEIGEAARTLLGLEQPMRLRWLAPEHLAYVRGHRQRLRGGLSAAYAPPFL